MNNAHDFELVRYRLKDGKNVIAIAGSPGRKWINVVWIDHTIRCHRIALAERRHFTPLKKPSLLSAAESMLDVGTRLGITATAERFLQQIVPGSVPDCYVKPSGDHTAQGLQRTVENTPYSSPDPLNVTPSVNVECVRCKKSFQSKRRSAQYCSPACRQKTYRRRKIVTEQTTGPRPECTT